MTEILVWRSWENIIRRFAEKGVHKVCLQE